MSPQLVLSLFPGIGLLDMAFEELLGAHIANAWAAAMIDGEGCFSIGKAYQTGHRTVYYRTDVKVCNTNRALLEPFVLLYGGRIDHTRKAEGNRRDGYQWTTTGSAHAARVVQEVRPFLIGKRAQAEIVLRAAALLIRKGGRRPAEELAKLEALKQEMHRLNARGRK